MRDQVEHLAGLGTAGDHRRDPAEHLLLHRQLPHLRLGAPPVADVLEDVDVPARRMARREERRGEDHRSPLAGGAGELEVDLALEASWEELGPGRLRADELGGRGAGQRGQLLVDVDDDPVAVEHGQAVLHRSDDGRGGVALRGDLGDGGPARAVDREPQHDPHDHQQRDQQAEERDEPRDHPVVRPDLGRDVGVDAGRATPSCRPRASAPPRPICAMSAASRAGPGRDHAAGVRERRLQIASRPSVTVAMASCSFGCALRSETSACSCLVRLDELLPGLRPRAPGCRSPALRQNVMCATRTSSRTATRLSRAAFTRS